MNDGGPQQAPYGEQALAFANALVAGDFESAHRLLSPALRGEYPPARLRQEYEDMFSYAGNTAATRVDLGSTMDDWPGKADAEVGWAYVSISGPNVVIGGEWCEAVAVAFVDVDGRLLICDIQWGRP